MHEHERIERSDLVNPASLSPDAKQSFADALYMLHTHIFAGVDKTHFINHVIDSPAEWNRIRVYKNQRDEWVGYCAVHRFKVCVGNRTCVVFRAEAGILREYRGRSQTLWFGFEEAIHYRLQHPFATLYYLGTFVHPAVLYMFSRYFDQYYPHGDQALPAQIKNIMLELAEAFHIAPVQGSHFLVRDVGWVTRESAADARFWTSHTHPMVQFYLQTNPGYKQGHGLLVLVPLTFNNIFFSLLRFLGKKIQRSIWKKDQPCKQAAK